MHARAEPFKAFIAPEKQFNIAAILLLTGILCTAAFAMTSGLRRTIFIMPASFSLGLSAIYTLGAAGVKNLVISK